MMRRWQVADALERPSQHTRLLADATVTAVEGEVAVQAQAALFVAMIAPAVVAHCRPRSTWPPPLPWLCSNEGQQERRGGRKEGAGEATQPTVQPMSNRPPMQCHNARQPFSIHPLHSIETNSLFAMHPSSPLPGVAVRGFESPAQPAVPSLPRPRDAGRAKGDTKEGGKRRTLRDCPFPRFADSIPLVCGAPLAVCASPLRSFAACFFFVLPWGTLSRRFRPGQPPPRATR